MAQAGIDVEPWGFKRDGTRVSAPRANPAYCYEWAFGSDAEGYVLCIWHDSLKEAALPEGPALAFQENLRQLALSLDRIAIDRSQPTDIRNRAPMNEVWTEWVDKKNLPARACVEARLADPKALVEIMVIAGR